MNKGFTLVELIAVVTILALLAVITTPAYETISTSVKTRNYNSKKESIKAQTLSYVEKYMKDKVYSGETDQNECYDFTVQFLIRNGIINSDDEKDEYIKNDISDMKYREDDVLVKVYYDNNDLKLKALAVDDEGFGSRGCDKKCDINCS